ncbi:hypothetical protein B0H12DRAFT_1071659 [Mycena haematopus]|nr:hypothetical protein B0H12DRAFT_1071659 [Mycena haematopus]
MSQINSVVNILYDSIRLPDVCIQSRTRHDNGEINNTPGVQNGEGIRATVYSLPPPSFSGDERRRRQRLRRESDDDTGWQPPDEDSDAEDAGDDELRAQMRNIYLRQSAIGRLRTNDLFQKDPAIFGRAQSPIADLMTRIFEIEHEHEVLEAEVYAVAQRLGSTQALLEELQEQHLRLDADRQRKRPTLESAAVDLTTNVERLHSPTEVMDIDPDQSVTRTVQASVRDVSVRTSEEKSSKELLRELQGQAAGAMDSNHKSQQIKGVPAHPPDWVVDLRDARGHQVVMTLAPSGIGRRSKATRSRYRIGLLAILRILIIPGAYAASLQRISVPVSDVPLSRLTFGSGLNRLNDDIVAQELAAHGLTVVIADDCWQFCLKFAEAEFNSSASGYDKEELKDLIAKAQAKVSVDGAPPGIRPAIHESVIFSERKPMTVKYYLLMPGASGPVSKAVHGIYLREIDCGNIGLPHPNVDRLGRRMRQDQEHRN